MARTLVKQWFLPECLAPGCSRQAWGKAHVKSWVGEDRRVCSGACVQDLAMHKR